MSVACSNTDATDSVPRNGQVSRPTIPSDASAQLRGTSFAP